MALKALDISCFVNLTPQYYEIPRLKYIPQAN